MHSRLSLTMSENQGAWIAQWSRQGPAVLRAQGFKFHPGYSGIPLAGSSKYWHFLHVHGLPSEPIALNSPQYASEAGKTKEA